MSVPAEILYRMMHIQNPQTSRTGSAFVIEVDSVEYICTARHIFDGFTSGEISIRYDQNWIKIPVVIVGVGRGDDDVIVFRPMTQFRKVTNGELSIQTSNEGMVFAQEAFVLGYPFQWENSVPKEVSGGWPFPIAKRTIIAGWPAKDLSSDILLDCQVNPGFSGGPVALNIHDTKKWAIIGTVKGYHWKPILDSQGSNKTPVPTGFSVATDIRRTMNLIAGLPSDAPVE